MALPSIFDNQHQEGGKMDVAQKDSVTMDKVGQDNDRMTAFQAHRSGLKKHKGFTLIELLLVLAIGASILFGVFLLVSKIQSKSVAQAAAQNLNIMVADVRAKYRSQGNFTGITEQALIDNQIPPDNMVSGGNIINGWNTQVTVAPATLNTANDAVAFTYPQIPQEDCSNFVQASEGAFSRISVAGTDVKAPGTAMNIATLGAQCTSAQFVDVTFTQGR